MIFDHILTLNFFFTFLFKRVSTTFKILISIFYIYILKSERVLSEIILKYY